MKLYVVEKNEVNADGEIMRVVMTYRSKPHRFNYIIFI